MHNFQEIIFGNMIHKLLFVALLSFSGTAPASMAQKKSKPSSKTIERAVDYSQYTDNPICQVTIIDSLVVPVHEAIKNIPLPAHLGKIFPSSEINGRMVYENEFGDMRMYSTIDDSGHHRIYTQTLLANKWSTPEAVEINGDFTDVINPFPMPDGQTIFFSARTASAEGDTSFSLYTTTYDSETCTYLAPTKLPFPFVSSANDLYYIEDEADGIAWLVTTRSQPDGKACIYTMLNKQPWRYYNPDETTPAKLRDYALIKSISDTWNSPTDRNRKCEEVKAALASYKDSPSTFVNEESTARRTLSKKVAELQRQINEYRRIYYKTPADMRSRIADTLREAEAQLSQYRTSLRQL